MTAFRTIIIDDGNLSKRIYTEKTFVFDDFNRRTAINALTDTNMLPIISTEDNVDIRWTSPMVATFYLNGKAKCQLENIKALPSEAMEWNDIIGFCFSKLDSTLSIDHTGILLSAMKGESKANAFYVSYLFGQLRSAQQEERSRKMVDVLHLYWIAISDPKPEFWEGAKNLFLAVKNNEEM